MSEKRDKRPSFWSLVFIAVIVFGLGSVSYGATFTNSSPITIPLIGNGSPYPSPINVTGLSGTVTNVNVTFNNFTHTFPDDIAIVLVGPTGAALLLQDGNGDDVVDPVTYTLSDSGSTLLPDEDPWGPGTYKPAAYFTGDSFPAPGPLLVYNHPGPAGGNTATFASTFNGTAPNGNWNLFIRDFVNGDGGSISGGWTISVTTTVAPGPTQNYIDMNGDGKTDYSVVRNTGGGPGGQITWFTQFAGGTTTQIDAWGIASDFFVPGNYDADNKTDIAIWRPASQGYYILQSATATVRAEFFGLSGDDPRVVGDYNGDGLDDIAVYRAGAASGNPSFWYWRQALAGPVFAVQWGQNGDFPSPGDYDGDNKSDFVVQRNAGGGQARFWRLFATGSSDSFVFGTPTDVIVPGDYDADGKTDIATIRGSGGQILWWVHPSGGGADSAQFWGNSATDFPTQGDYDGDGKTDICIWRPNADPTQNFYYVLGSTSGFFSQEWGQNGDYPVANYNAH